MAQFADSFQTEARDREAMGADGEATAPGPVPTIPAMPAWWRAPDEEARPFLGSTPCPRCLLVSRLVCDGAEQCTTDTKASHAQDNTSRHAAALRVWLWARAQQALALSLIRGSK